jgi:hypothetical protein
LHVEVPNIRAEREGAVATPVGGWSYIMRPIDARASGFFASGSLNGTGSKRLWTSRQGGAAGRAVRPRATKPQRLEFVRHDKIDKHLQLFI